MLELIDTVDRVMHEAGVHPVLWNTGTTYDIPLQQPLDRQRATDYAVRFYLVGLIGYKANLRRMYFYNWGGTKIPIVLQAVGGAPTEAALAVEQLQRWLAHASVTSCGHGAAMHLPDNVWQCAFVLREPGGSRSAVIRWTSQGTAVTDVGTATTVHRLDGTVTPVQPGSTIEIAERPVLLRSS